MLEKRLQRLERLAADKPALASVCRYYASLYRLFAEAEPFLDAAFDAAATQRQQQGFPLLRGELLQIDAGAAATFFARLLAVMAGHGEQGQDELARLQSALDDGRLDLPLLLRATLDRDRRPVTAAAEAVGVSPALLEYGLATALGAALERCRQAAAPVCEDWDEGYCPFCGGLPAIAELRGEEGKKLLQCSLCGQQWAFRRLTCIHCGNTDHESLAYFTIEGEPGCRVDICRRCSGYLKVIDSRARGENLPLEVEDAATLQLDLLAAREGFTRGRKEQPGN